MPMAIIPRKSKMMERAERQDRLRARKSLMTEIWAMNESA